MTTLGFEGHFAWQALRALKACAGKRVSSRKLWLRRGEVEAIAMHTESPCDPARVPQCSYRCSRRLRLRIIAAVTPLTR
jgi:hypothetical protein